MNQGIIFVCTVNEYFVTRAYQNIEHAWPQQNLLVQFEHIRFLYNTMQETLPRRYFGFKFYQCTIA